MSWLTQPAGPDDPSTIAGMLLVLSPAVGYAARCAWVRFRAARRRS